MGLFENIKSDKDGGSNKNLWEERAVEEEPIPVALPRREDVRIRGVAHQQQ